MSKRRIVWLSVVGVVIIAASLFVKTIADRQNFSPIDLKSPQAQAIELKLTEAYRVKTTIACDSTADVALLDRVMVDTSDAELNDSQRETIARVFGAQALERAGYLTALKAYYLEIRGDYPSTTGAASSNLRPTPKPIFACPYPGAVPGLEFIFVGINGDRAQVRFDDGAALEEAVLIRRNDRWFVANIKPIHIHL